MKNHIFTFFNLFLRMYASLFLGVTVLILPSTIWFNQNIAFALSSPLFMSSILKQNVLDALNIVLFNSDQSTKFIQSEVLHLKDVHVLFVYFYLFGLIAIILFWKFFRRQRVPRKYLAITCAAIFLFTLILAIFFPFFFEIFHKVLFPQGNFSFPEDSLLIQTFPPIFWFLQFIELQIIVCLSLLLQFRDAE